MTLASLKRPKSKLTELWKKWNTKTWHPNWPIPTNWTSTTSHSMPWKTSITTESCPAKNGTITTLNRNLNTTKRENLPGMPRVSKNSAWSFTKTITTMLKSKLNICRKTPWTNMSSNNTCVKMQSKWAAEAWNLTSTPKIEPRK